MAQLEGFINEQFCTHVCKLKKAIYNLKQDYKAWYPLKQLGFHGYDVDAYIMYNKDGKTVIFIVYMDDILIIRNDACLIRNIVNQLNVMFSLKS